MGVPIVGSGGLLGPIVPLARTPEGNVVVWVKAVGKKAAATAPAIATGAERIANEGRVFVRNVGVVDKGN